MMNQDFLRYELLSLLYLQYIYLQILLKGHNLLYHHLLMPYDDFLENAKKNKYDVEILMHHKMDLVHLMLLLMVGKDKV